jgi:4-amino-4-deoxy-L-arabinose transferase-like glycosyltransferase
MRMSLKIRPVGLESLPMVTQARTAAAAAAAPGERSRPATIPADLWVLAAITVLAAVLRFATLTDQSLWYDEAQAVHEMGRSFGGMLHLWNVNEPNPPLFFVVAWPWARLFGTGAAGIRSLSAVAGVALIPIMWACGRELISSRAGLVAAAFAAVNPLLIWYSQEAREYMLLTTLCAGSLLMFARARREPSARRIAWWAGVSALALATQYFAAFLVFAEALWLVWTARSGVSVVALLALVAVEGALLPHAIAHESHPTQWIDSVGPLSVRLRQLPVIFAVNTLYKSGSALARDGLLLAALLAAVVIVLLVVGAGGRELRGAGVAAALAGCVLLIPLGLALVGHDYYETRAMIGAWVPLALVVGAACATSRLRVPGAILAAALLVLFVWAGIRVDGNQAYQRPDWGGVAAALGHARGPRAIVAYDGTYATAPLALYLRGVSWNGSSENPQPIAWRPVTVNEVDVIGNTAQHVRTRLPRGIHLISQRAVAGYLVARFALSAPWHLTPQTIADAHAPRLLGPAGPGGKVLVQQPLR